jgi:ketosteroid isomerase-like protein
MYLLQISGGAHAVRAANFTIGSTCFDWRMKMNNTQTIMAIYDAFGRGDIPTILSKMADDVEWDYNSSSIEVPWLKKRRGVEGVAEFLQSLKGLEFHNFQPTEFFEGDGIVVAVLNVDFTVKATGRRITEEDITHVWRFSPDGKIVKYRHGVDSYEHALAAFGRVPEPESARTQAQ